MVVGVGLGFLVNAPFGLTVLALWVMGCIYNIPPVRSKDLPYLDVLSESINNPLRMLAGWYMTGIDAFAPTSLLRELLDGRLLLHGAQAVSPSTARSATRSGRPSYRASFAYYTPERLLVSIMFYASAAMLFLGAFVMRYRLELILAFPLIAVVMAIYLHLAFQPDSAVINPEKLYRQKPLMIAVGVCTILDPRAVVRRHPVARHDLPPDRSDPDLTGALWTGGVAPLARAGRRATGRARRRSGGGVDAGRRRAARARRRGCDGRRHGGRWASVRCRRTRRWRSSSGSTPAGT